MISKTYSFEAKNQTIDVYTLTNSVGAKVEVMTYGARIFSAFFPDRNGKFSDVIMGYATPELYLKEGNKAYYGATIGRYCNRIGGASFVLDGVKYNLVANNGANCLHGGKEGFDKQNFDAEIVGNSLVLKYFSKDGEQEFPGNMNVKVVYTLTEDNSLAIEYYAVSDKNTVCNFTNHAYFNIGDDADILDQVLDINSSKITPVDKELIPHNDFLDIENTPYSFKGGVKLGKNMFVKEGMIGACSGFDFNYCIDRITDNDLEFCASVYDEKSGRKMDCFTTLPGVQLYTCNKAREPQGKRIVKDYFALCLETQGYPNSPNCDKYPSTFLRKGEEYYSKTVYKFSVK